MNYVIYITCAGWAFGILCSALAAVRSARLYREARSRSLLSLLPPVK